MDQDKTKKKQEKRRRRESSKVFKNQARQSLAASDKGSWLNQESLHGLMANQENTKTYASASGRKIWNIESNESETGETQDLICLARDRCRQRNA